MNINILEFYWYTFKNVLEFENDCLSQLQLMLKFLHHIHTLKIKRCTEWKTSNGFGTNLCSSKINGYMHKQILKLNKSNVQQKQTNQVNYCQNLFQNIKFSFLCSRQQNYLCIRDNTFEFSLVWLQIFIYLMLVIKPNLLLL